MDWPIQTYLDAMAFRRVDIFEQPAFDSQVRLMTINDAGELQPSRYASDVEWHRVLAFRPIDNGPECAPCTECGEFVARLGYTVCEGCVADDWLDYV